jgi:hypothetical protein
MIILEDIKTVLEHENKAFIQWVVSFFMQHGINWIATLQIIVWMGGEGHMVVNWNMWMDWCDLVLCISFVHQVQRMHNIKEHEKALTADTVNFWVL